MRQRRPMIAGVILAAGMSKRLGQTKQLLKIDGKYLLERVVDTATNSTLSKIYLVLGWHYEQILNSIPQLKHNPKVRILYNPDYARGIGSSVRCGLTAARQKYDHVMFLVADQPFLSARLIETMIEKYVQSDRQICIPLCQGQKGNPTIFGANYFDQLLQISGDKGGREIIANNSQGVLYVPVKDPEELFDIDTRTDLEFLSPLVK